MAKDISRVNRSKKEAKKFYDRISGSYDWLGGIFERRPAEKALNHLKIQSGETVLEIGFGTGYCLQRIAMSVGDSGKAYGIDISEGMIHRTRERLDKVSLLNRVELYRGDATKLLFDDETFDAVFISFTLELFDSPEISEVLGEIRRVLKPGGRLGVVSLSKANADSATVRIYEWMHNKWPKYIDCRPIYVNETVGRSGFKIIVRKTARIIILPIEIVVAIKDAG
jgi:demethylmenaquinone methyltransferase/2-methoxy-6-polyprenyl-1,4-benzoquinol methylase